MVSSQATCKNLIYRKDMISNFSACTCGTLLCVSHTCPLQLRYTFWTDHTHCRAIKVFWFGEIKAWLHCANEQSSSEDASTKVKGKRSCRRVKTQRGVSEKYGCLPYGWRVLSLKGCHSICWKAAKKKEIKWWHKEEAAELGTEQLWHSISNSLVQLCLEHGRCLPAPGRGRGCSQLDWAWGFDRGDPGAAKLDLLPPLPALSPHLVHVGSCCQIFPFQQHFQQQANICCSNLLLRPSYPLCQGLGKSQWNQLAASQKGAEIPSVKQGSVPGAQVG